MTAATYALVLTLALAVPYVAAAECAWVLWSQATERGETSTSPLGASGTKAECETARLEAIDKLKSLDSDAVKVTKAGGLLMLLIGERVTTFGLTCLPDTVDPRGPKGGGR